MADEHLPASFCPRARPEIVVPDAGAWISGPGVNAEQVPAEHLQAGDRLILDDDLIVGVDSVRHGWYWFAEGHEPGVAVGWKAVTGQSSGVLFRRGSDVLARIAR